MRDEESGVSALSKARSSRAWPRVALSSAISMEDQQLRAQPSATAAPVEMEFGEEELVTLETGEVLAFDKPVIMPPVEMEFAGQVTVATEAGEVLVFE